MGDRYVCRRASRQADATKSRKKRKLNANQSSTAAFRINFLFEREKRDITHDHLEAGRVATSGEAAASTPLIFKLLSISTNLRWESAEARHCGMEGRVRRRRFGARFAAGRRRRRAARDWRRVGARSATVYLSILPLQRWQYLG
jgi:hypothetical protein